MWSKTKRRIILPLLGIVLLVGGTFGTVGIAMAADGPIATPKVTFIERVADALGIEAADLKDAFAQVRDSVQDIDGESRMEAFKAELDEILHLKYGVAEDITIQSVIDQIKTALQERFQARKAEMKEQLEGRRAEMQERLQTCKTEMKALFEAKRAQMQERLGICGAGVEECPGICGAGMQGCLGACGAGMQEGPGTCAAQNDAGRIQQRTRDFSCCPSS
ncbi:MAG: hypothetical protein J7K94_07140 [Dehalococcoidia bacterium]|nr:hypothetical protein [Dehalococcoidia bacterium]